MKKLLLVLITVVSYGTLQAQTAPGPVQKKMLDSLCNCMSKLDFSKITSSAEANQAFMVCFTQHAELLTEVADELKIDISSEDGGDKIGELIGKSLLQAKCGSFLKLATIIAKKDLQAADAAQTTSGVFKRVDLKGFNYVVLTEPNGTEKSFLWLRQFPGSEKLQGPAAQLTGKKNENNLARDGSLSAAGKRIL